MSVTLETKLSCHCGSAVHPTWSSLCHVCLQSITFASIQKLLILKTAVLGIQARVKSEKNKIVRIFFESVNGVGQNSVNVFK